MRGKHTLLALLALGAMFGATGARSNTIPGDLVSGPVTAVSGAQSVSIQGKAYRIKAGSPAAVAAGNLRPGQLVDAQLNGPVGSSSSQVINIVLRSGH